jgi:CcmD family protein
MKKALISLIGIQLLMVQFLHAQSGDADFMRSIGKIYVVVAVIVAIFLGIILFLIYLDRKLTKLENQINEHD